MKKTFKTPPSGLQTCFDGFREVLGTNKLSRQGWRPVRPGWESIKTSLNHTDWEYSTVPFCKTLISTTHEKVGISQGFWMIFLNAEVS